MQLQTCKGLIEGEGCTATFQYHMLSVLPEQGYFSLPGLLLKLLKQATLWSPSSGLLLVSTLYPTRSALMLCSTCSCLPGCLTQLPNCVNKPRVCSPTLPVLLGMSCSSCCSGLLACFSQVELPLQVQGGPCCQTNYIVESYIQQQPVCHIHSSVA